MISGAGLLIPFAINAAYVSNLAFLSAVAASTKQLLTNAQNP